MFSADCTEAKTVSQGHIHWLEIRCELYLDAGEEGMIHLLAGSYVETPDSVFL